jgi:hypothetical protein
VPANDGQLYSNTPRRRKCNLLPKQNKTPHSTHRSATPPPASTSSSAAATTARRLPLPAIAARPLPPPRAPRRDGERAGGWIEVWRESFEARAVLYPCRAAPFPRSLLPVLYPHFPSTPAVSRNGPRRAVARISGHLRATDRGG